MVVVAGAPLIAKNPRMFASRSVTTIVTALPRDAAADAACWRIVCTSVEVKLVVIDAGGLGVAGRPGGGTAFRSSGGPPPTWPMPTRTRLLTTSRYLILTRTSPSSGRSGERRMTIDEA